MGKLKLSAENLTNTLENIEKGQNNGLISTIPPEPRAAARMDLSAYHTGSWYTSAMK